VIDDDELRAEKARVLAGGPPSTASTCPPPDARRVQARSRMHWRAPLPRLRRRIRIGAAKQRRELPMVSPSAGPHPAAGRSGLVTFAGIMLLVAAAFNLLDGIVALVNDDYYAVDELLFGDLSLWGAWWLFIGSALLLAGWGVLTRKAWAEFLGIGLAGINAFTQLMFLGVYPAWSIAAMAVDGLIIYALTANFEEFD